MPKASAVRLDRVEARRVAVAERLVPLPEATRDRCPQVYLDHLERLVEVPAKRDVEQVRSVNLLERCVG